ncbi:hypothetical protein [Streptomyces sp. AcH 505]|uniref:hypothetical protein n=1 Tax=Streptomyces sp. AcH 505 TaxID=352211 RepID=UPI0012FF3346
MKTEIAAALFGGTGVALGAIVTGAFNLIKGRQENRGKINETSYAQRRELYARFYQRTKQIYNTHHVSDSPLSQPERIEVRNDIKSMHTLIQIDGTKKLRKISTEISITSDFWIAPRGYTDPAEIMKLMNQFSQEARKALGIRER